MSITFTLIAISYVAFVFMILMTFHFLRDRNTHEIEIRTIGFNAELNDETSHLEAV